MTRPFDIITADQRSQEWRQARCGRLTGSCARDMLATIKSGAPAQSRKDLLVQLVCERLTGAPQENDYVNAAMQWGIDCEPLAFAAYEALTGTVAQRVGFLAHRHLLIGCSPDGVIDEFAGLLELKCPKSATHWTYRRAGVVPPDYLPQITHNLWVSGAEYCDFLSFDPRFPPDKQTFYVRVPRASLDIDGYAAKAMAFLEEVERELSVEQGWRALEVVNG